MDHSKVSDNPLINRKGGKPFMFRGKVQDLLESIHYRDHSPIAIVFRINRELLSLKSKYRHDLTDHLSREALENGWKLSELFFSISLMDPSCFISDNDPALHPSEWKLISYEEAKEIISENSWR